MNDMTATLAELDRLHAEAVTTSSPRRLSIALINAHPALRSHIAELERKAAAWDAVKGNIHEAASGTGKFEGYECDAWWHEEHPTATAISAALAAKGADRGDPAS